MLLGRERREPQVMAGSLSLAEGARLAARLWTAPVPPPTEGDGGCVVVGEAALLALCFWRLADDGRRLKRGAMEG